MPVHHSVTESKLKLANNPRFVETIGVALDMVTYTYIYKDKYVSVSVVLKDCT